MTVRSKFGISKALTRAVKLLMVLWNHISHLGVIQAPWCQLQAADWSLLIHLKEIKGLNLKTIKRKSIDWYLREVAKVSSEFGTSQKLSRMRNSLKLMERTTVSAFGLTMSLNHTGNYNTIHSLTSFWPSSQIKSSRFGTAKMWLTKRQSTILLTKRNARKILAQKAPLWKIINSIAMGNNLPQPAVAGYLQIATYLWLVSNPLMSHSSITTQEM